MADIKNFGIKGIAADVQLGKAGGRLKYDSANNRFDLTQSDGSTLEDLRLGAVAAGTWTATAIGTQYGGTGTDLSSSTGIVQVNSGVGSAGNIDLADANFIDTNSNLAIAQGGTGATSAADARTNLELGTLAIQDANNVALSGGAIDGVVIGGSTAAAITGSTITANTGFVGDLTGDVTGNADTATALASAQNFSASGDASASAVSFDGTGAVDLALTLANSGVTAGDYGSTTAVPVISVDAKGRITSATTASISTSFGIAGDSGTDTVNGGDTLTFAGTASQIETTITDNNVEIGIVDGASIANLTVTGTFTSDDITSAAISIDGDATITGNLTVQGTQTIVNSTTVQTEDAVFRTNSSGVDTDAGFEANTASGVKQILYTSVGGEWDFGTENVNAATFTGDLTGDVTGDLNGLSYPSADGTANQFLQTDGSGNLSFATVNTDLVNDTTPQLGGDLDSNGNNINVNGAGAAAAEVKFYEAPNNGLNYVALRANPNTFSSYTLTLPIFTGSADQVLKTDGSGNLSFTTINTDLVNDTTPQLGGELDNNGNDIRITNGSLLMQSGANSGSIYGSLVYLGNQLGTAGTLIIEGDGVGTAGRLDATGTITLNDIVYPSADGTAGQVLQTDGSGNLSFATIADLSDGLILRSAISADSASSTFDVGTMPNVSGRTYYADKVVIKVSTAFSGGSVNAIKITENSTGGTTLVDVDDADVTTTGTYIVELDGEITLTKNAAITVSFVESDGSTASIPTGGAMTVSAHYNWV